MTMMVVMVVMVTMVARMCVSDGDAECQGERCRGQEFRDRHWMFLRVSRCPSHPHNGACALFHPSGANNSRGLCAHAAGNGEQAPFPFVEIKALSVASGAL
jgi:hypothetical protein